MNPVNEFVEELFVELIHRNHFGIVSGAFVKQLPQFMPRLNQVLYAGYQSNRTKWFGDVIIRTGFVTGDFEFFRLAGRKQNHGNVAGLRVGFETLAKLHATHFRHHDVTQHQIRNHLKRLIQPFQSIAGYLYPKFVLQNPLQIFPHPVIILHDKDNGQISGICFRLN